MRRAGEEAHLYPRPEGKSPLLLKAVATPFHGSALPCLGRATCLHLDILIDHLVDTAESGIFQVARVYTEMAITRQ